MTKRGAMWPTALMSDKSFVKLGPLEQLLFMKQLWLSPLLDSAGFHPLQMAKWGRGFSPQATEAEMREVVGSLEAQNWVAVDYETEEVFVVPFIRWDACKQPQIYVAACRAIQAAQSAELRRKAWEQVMIVHPPKVKHDPKKLVDPGERLEAMQNAAYEELREFMEANEGGGL